MDGFVEAMLRAPVGVALLARLESHLRNPEGYGLMIEAEDPAPEAVAATVDAVGAMSFGELVRLIVVTGYLDVGPWMSTAPSTAAEAYRHAEARAPIAEAVAARFGDELHAPVDRGRQQWWTDEHAFGDRIAPLFRRFEQVYDAGQFTWAGLWTVTDAADAAHADLIGAWEMETGAVSRWRLPVVTGARLFEVHRPADWTRLVAEYPRPAAREDSHWALPGPNQRVGDLTPLLGVPGQRAARTSMRRHLVPDWRAVSERYDGVHLSWAGFITSEGCITDLDDGDVTMLRFWFSERTHWLADVFGEPEPLPAPWLPYDTLVGADATTDGARRVRDARLLDRLLGR